MNQQTPAVAATCSSCSNPVATGARFCGACGKAIPVQPVCPSCGAPLADSVKFCRKCGIATAVTSEPSSSQGVVEDAGFSKRRSPGASPVAEHRKQPQRTWWSTILMIINPGQLLAQRMATVSWPSALMVSGGAFTLFFLQTGLDRARHGGGQMMRTTGLTIAGAFYGTVGVALIGFVAWVLSKLYGGKQPAGWVIRALALSYGPTLVYVAFGLAFNLLFRWNTSIAFGVTGVLWALGPMIAVFKELSGGKTGGSIIMASVCGGLILFGWAAFAVGIPGR